MAKELLKEAIADAKAVREVALQNAKMALEEAFDSKIKNMLSAKLAEEIEEDVELEEVYEEDDVTSEGDTYEEDDVTTEEVELEEDIDEEINLDELMAELEEMSNMEEDEPDAKKEGMNKYEEDDQAMEEATLEEADMDAALASAKEKAKKAGKSGAAALKYIADLLTGKEFIDSGITTTKREGVEETNESIDINALIAEIESELEEGKTEKKDNEKEQMKEELHEALATVDSLKSTISEMNLLNSKLLYCNKLFRANALTEAQKVKVIDALDKSATTGEAKLVFETLQESFAFTGVEKRAIKEGLGRASKASGVAPKKVIMESTDETVSRFQKLANIKL